MSIQQEMEAAAQEYARRLEQQREADRLEALRLEAREHGNASAFAEAVEAAFAQLDNDHDTDSTDTHQEN